MITASAIGPDGRSFPRNRVAWLPAVLCGLLLVGCTTGGGATLETGIEPGVAMSDRSPVMPAGASPVASDTPPFGLSPVEAVVAAKVDSLTPAAVAFLERIVNVNSGTMNHAGIREVGRMFETEFLALGMETTWIPMPGEVNRAGHLFAETSGGAGATVLLIGHLDTVYELDSPFQRYEDLGNGLARGPGVSDMKGGDVVILLALQALRAAGQLDDLNLIVALLGDEEQTGAPLTISRQHLVKAARRSDAALGFEGGVGGLQSATVARRGFTDWRLEVTGTRGHSSAIFNDRYGAGAAFEAARILDEFYDDLRGEENLTFGAGIMLGGTDVEYDPETDRGAAFGKTNVIPQTVIVAGDLRALTSEQLERAKQRMRLIVADHLPRTSAEITFEDSYPPMAPAPGNLALLDRLDQVSRDLGMGPIEVVDPGRRGAADISFAAQYTAALGGLGVMGHGAHTPDETVDLASIPVMAKRAALLVLRLGAAPESLPAVDR